MVGRMKWVGARNSLVRIGNPRNPADRRGLGWDTRELMVKGSVHTGHSGHLLSSPGFCG